MTHQQQQQQHPATAPAADQLMAKPAMTWDEFWSDLLAIPNSTAEQLAREPNAPKFFLLGRRRYIRTVDAIAWIDEMASAAPYCPRRYQRRAA